MCVSSRSYHSATPLPSGDVLIIGGLGEGPYIDGIELYQLR